VKFTQLARIFGQYFSLEKLCYKTWQNTVSATFNAICSQKHVVTLPAPHPKHNNASLLQLKNVMVLQRAILYFTPGPQQ
jgi:hypothetical protein